MEYCNKDEAVRAKSIAEDKIHKRDFISARKFALKAKKLWPGLDGISQMLTTIDVYVSADQNKIRGEVDWYSVLGLKPSVDDDDEAIKKQYKKMALVLHPDKNKSVGAHEAFVLISEAFGILLDKAKRLAYKKRRGLIRVSQGHKTTTSKTMKTPPAARKPTPRRVDTFWTIYRRCRMHLNHTLGSHVPFIVFLVTYFVALVVVAKRKSVTRIQ